MRNVVRIGALLLVILGLGACMGQPGQPYLVFDWTYEPYPDTFSTTAPGVPTRPAMVYPLTQYPVDEGTWYVEYFHSSPPAPTPPVTIPPSTGWWRWTSFTITAHAGEFMKNGDDSLFKIYLNHLNSPTFTQYYSLTGAPTGTAGDAPLAGITRAERPMDTSGYDRQTLGSFSQVSGGYKMTGTYGVYVPKK